MTKERRAKRNANKAKARLNRSRILFRKIEEQEMRIEQERLRKWNDAISLNKDRI